MVLCHELPDEFAKLEADYGPVDLEIVVSVQHAQSNLVISRAMVMHYAFDWVAGGILMANCIMIGFQVQYKAIERRLRIADLQGFHMGAHADFNVSSCRTNDVPAYITLIDLMFSAWFVTELALRLFANGPHGFFFAKDWSSAALRNAAPQC
eukprot:6147373-Amphidinium_carterae.1